MLHDTILLENATNVKECLHYMYLVSCGEKDYNGNMILHCGEALIDFIVDEQGHYRPVPGGSPFNTTITSARLGAHSCFLGKLSLDFFGDMLQEALEASKVDLRFSPRVQGPTPLVFVHLSETRDAIMSFYLENSVAFSYEPSDLPEGLPDELWCVQLGSIASYVEPTATTLWTLVEREKERRVISYDPNLRISLMQDQKACRKIILDGIGASDILKLNEEELVWLYPDMNESDALASCMKKDLKLCCLTRGSGDATLFTSSQKVELSPPQITVVDTVGAGDSFHGALLAWLESRGICTGEAIGLLSHDALHEMGHFAMQVASITCSRKGANPPYKKDLSVS